MTRPDASRHKRAELAGSAGAGVLGAGLGALFAQWAAPFAVVLLVLGVLLHGWGMVEKRRLEAGATSPAWSKALYWVCWILLAILMIWIGFRSLRG
jgi:drug/metabolite transporter (DMT)-like permease